MTTPIRKNKKLPTVNKKTAQLFQEENDCWRRVLAFLQAENNYLKVRLAHLVNGEISKKFLAQAESLQSELIQNDELIALTRSALSEFDNYLNRYSENNRGIEDVSKRHEKLRQQMDHLEYNFSKNRAKFNEHLMQNI